jgi:hypothetical protein
MRSGGPFVSKGGQFFFHETTSWQSCDERIKPADEGSHPEVLFHRVKGAENCVLRAGPTRSRETGRKRSFDVSSAIQ